MSYDRNCPLWPREPEHFYHALQLSPQQQIGPRCVATSLAILSGQPPAHFDTQINTQDPASWSDALRPYNMTFAYCSTDLRKMRFYMQQLLQLDDLFALCYYTRTSPEELLRDPSTSGWLTGSHIVIMHRDQIFDPASGQVSAASEHLCNSRHTKRIFRVVPPEHPRGL